MQNNAITIVIPWLDKPLAVKARGGYSFPTAGETQVGNHCPTGPVINKTPIQICVLCTVSDSMFHYPNVQVRLERGHIVRIKFCNVKYIGLGE